MAHLLLPALLENTASRSSTSPPFILITDTILQSGLALLRQFVSSSLARDEHVLLIALEQVPSRLLGTTRIGSNTNPNLHVIDTVSHLYKSYGSESNDQLPLDLFEDDTVAVLKKLIESVTNAIEKVGKRKIIVVVDSTNAMEDSIASHGIHTFMRTILGVLHTQADPSSRLLALHHLGFPSLPSEGATSSFSLESLLLSPALSSSTVHLKLHPSPLLELLSRDYSLQIPLQPSSSHPLDLRLPEFLTSFTKRSYGDPFVRPKSTRDEDERISIDLLNSDQSTSGARGGCVVEWETRGVNLPTAVMRNSIGGLVNGKIEKRVLIRGLEGLLRVGSGVEGAGLDKVLTKDKMASIIPLPTPIAPTNPTGSAPRPPGPATGAPSTKTTSTNDIPLPFNLSLTSSQESARQAVPLPFVPKEGAAGMYQGIGIGSGPGEGKVEYEFDEGDDMDDDDPDEDLEV